MARKYGFGRVFRYRGKGPWWIEYYHRGKPIRESSKSYRKSDAVSLLNQRRQEAGTGALVVRRRVLVEELLDDLLRDFRDNGKSIAWAEIIDGHLRPFFGTLTATEVGTSAIEAYISRRRADGVGNSTINRELARLKRAYHLGMETEPPKVARAPRIAKLKEPPPRRGFFEWEDFARVRRELPESLRPLVTFLYYTGCRVGESSKIRWDQVDFAEKVIRLEPGETKNDESRDLPILRELTPMLEMLKQARDAYYPESPWVFSRNGRRVKDFRWAWTKACEAAGVVGRLVHDLRRTGVRNLVRSGVPEAVAMRISGHKTHSVFQRYNIVSARDIREAALKLERYHDELRRAEKPASPKEPVN